MSRKIGYARVSKYEQNLEMQMDALLKAGCNKDLIFTDHISGSKTTRPGLDRCIESLEKGDTLMVWRLDRLGRSMPHLVSLVEDFKDRGVSFKSLRDGAIDTTTASGELVFNIFSSLAQFERKLIQERTLAGLNAARMRGRAGGRKKIIPSDPKVITAKKMHKDNNVEIHAICKMLDISRATFYRYLSLSQE